MEKDLSEQPTVRLAFLDIALFDDFVIRGGVLVIDMETRPYEFRVTSPVKPTPLQRILYGDALKDYVYVELLGLPLIKSIKEKPSLILVREKNLLAVRRSISVPIVAVHRDQRSITTTGDGKEKNLKPVTITAHQDFPGEITSAQALITHILQVRDILEPFERLRLALNEAHKQQIEEKATRGQSS